MRTMLLGALAFALGLPASYARAQFTLPTDYERRFEHQAQDVRDVERQRALDERQRLILDRRATMRDTRQDFPTRQPAEFPLAQPRGTLTSAVQDNPSHENGDRWRYVQHGGRWWYWTPDETWLIWSGDRWIPREQFQQFTGSYRTGYRGTPYTDRGFYNGRFYDRRFYGGYPSYGDQWGGGFMGPGGFYGPTTPGGMIGSGVGGAIGGQRGAVIGGAIGGW